MLGFINSVYGFEVVELKLPNSNKVIIKLMFRNGAVCDPVGKEGLTKLTASVLINGGTNDMTYSQIQEKLFPMAANYNYTVDKEVAILTFQVHKDFLDDFYKIMKGLLLTPRFDAEDFEREKSNFTNYVTKMIRTSSDEEYNKKLLENFLFRGTQYSYMNEGNAASLNNITLEDVKAHYKNYFTKNNLLLGIAGNYSGDFLNTLKSDLGNLSDVQPVQPTLVKPKMPDGINIEIIRKKTSGSAIFFGFPIDITRASDDFAALMVANSYLGEHRKSYGVLYNKLRETRSMNYGDYSYIEWYDNGGGNMLPPAGTPRSMNYFAIWIRPVQIASSLKQQYPELADIKVGHAHYAVRLAVREIEKLINEGISQKAFDETREFLMSYMKLYIQRPSDQLGYLMDSKFYGRTDYISDMVSLLSKLTKEDVDKAIKKYWQIENFYVSIVTDETEADALAESLLQNNYSPMSYANMIKDKLPAEVLAEDELVANYKLNVKKVNIIENADTFK